MSVYHREQFAQERLVLRLRREWALRSLLRLQLPAEPLAYHVGSVHSSPGREDSNLQIWKPPWTPRKLPVPHGRGRKKDITSERSRARAGSRTPEYTLRIYTCNLCKSTVITLQPCRQPALGASLRLFVPGPGVEPGCLIANVTSLPGPPTSLRDVFSVFSVFSIFSIHFPFETREPGQGVGLALCHLHAGQPAEIPDVPLEGSRHSFLITDFGCTSTAFPSPTSATR